jgi:hypothetical protein
LTNKVLVRLFVSMRLKYQDNWHLKEKAPFGEPFLLLTSLD